MIKNLMIPSGVLGKVQPTQEQIDDILRMHYSEINTDGICIYYNLDENIYRAKVEISNIIYSISSYDLEIIKNMALGLIG